MGEVYHLAGWQHRRLKVHTSFQVSTLKSNTLKCTTFQPICCLSMTELTQSPTSFTVIRWSARDMCALEVLANSISLHWHYPYKSIPVCVNEFIVHYKTFWLALIHTFLYVENTLWLVIVHILSRINVWDFVINAWIFSLPHPLPC